MNTKRILIFLAFAFGITWTATLTLRLTVGRNDLLKATMLANLIFTIWTPALANVFTRLITKEGWGHLMLRLNLRRGWRFYLAAWLLPCLAIIVGATLYYIVFPQSYDTNLTEMRRQLAFLPPLATWAPTASSWAVFLALMLYIMIVLMPAYTLIEFGEEFGWRAYLLPKLMQHFTKTSPADTAPIYGQYAAAARKASLLIGVIWWLWHLPGRIMFNPEFSIVPELVSIVVLCSLSLMLSWVTLRSGSMWPAAVGHAAHNNSLAYPMYSLKGPANLLLGPAGGLIGSIGYFVLGLVMFFNRKAFAGETAAQPESAPVVVSA